MYVYNHVALHSIGFFLVKLLGSQPSRLSMLALSALAISTPTLSVFFMTRVIIVSWNTLHFPMALDPREGERQRERSRERRREIERGRERDRERGGERLITPSSVSVAYFCGNYWFFSNLN